MFIESMLNYNGNMIYPVIYRTDFLPVYVDIF